MEESVDFLKLFTDALRDETVKDLLRNILNDPVIVKIDKIQDKLSNEISSLKADVEQMNTKLSTWTDRDGVRAGDDSIIKHFTISPDKDNVDHTDLEMVVDSPTGAVVLPAPQGDVIEINPLTDSPLHSAMISPPSPFLSDSYNSTLVADMVPSIGRSRSNSGIDYTAHADSLKCLFPTVPKYKLVDALISCGGEYDKAVIRLNSQFKPQSKHQLFKVTMKSSGDAEPSKEPPLERQNSCIDSLGQRSGLQNRMVITHHANTQLFDCTKCTRSFNNTAALETHLKSHDAMYTLINRLKLLVTHTGRQEKLPGDIPADQVQLYFDLMDYKVKDKVRDVGHTPIQRFLKLPVRKTAPQYYKQITYPMDMGMIGSKIWLRSYPDMMSLLLDLELMFYGESSSANHDVLVLRDFISSKVSTLLPAADTRAGQGQTGTEGQQPTSRAKADKPTSSMRLQACVICNVEFASPILLSEHIATHLPNLASQCAELNSSTQPMLLPIYPARSAGVRAAPKIPPAMLPNIAMALSGGGVVNISLPGTSSGITPYSSVPNTSTWPNNSACLVKRS